MQTPRLDRRSLLKLGLVTLAGVAVPAGRARASLLRLRALHQDAISYPKVRVLPERVTRQIAGLRPYRQSGFVVRTQRIAGKMVIHNYGHGGAGITLSWGTADLAVAMALRSVERKAAVIGCGAVGLATARLLQDRGFQVTIYARAVHPDTTSSVAAAMFSPVTLADQARVTSAFLRQLEHASRFSHRYFQTMLGARYGVRWMETFLVGDMPQSLPWGFALTPDLFPLTEIPAARNPFPTPYASRFYTMQIQTPIYLPEVLSDFLLRGGRLMIRDFPDLTSVLALTEPIIVNCTGMGAQPLFGDRELIPLKGQLIVLLPQPEINYAFVDGARSLYMFPRQDGILLGETEEAGVTSLEPNPTQTARIFEGIRQFFAAMR